MNRSKKRRQSDRMTVSLFPFLAVLICTLGILIVLLVISVQSASQEAQDRSDASQSEQEQQLTAVLESGEFFEFEAKNVLSVRDDVSQRLATAKSDRSYLEKQIKDLESEARAVYLQYQALQKRKDKTSSPEDEESVTKVGLEQLNVQIADVQRKIDLKRAAVPEVATTVNYQIVPFTGSGGTTRRPIFIECDAHGLILQPLGIRLAESDFVAPNRIGNVLDSALLAIREYYQKHGLANDDTKPYPLLIVRPEGAWAYSLARTAMKSWDDEFGYELVDQDTPLEFGNADRQLEQKVRETIETAHRRQLAIAQRSRRGGTKFGTAWLEGRGSTSEASFAGGRTGSKGRSDRHLQQASHAQHQSAESVNFAGGAEAGSQDRRTGQRSGEFDNSFEPKGSFSAGNGQANSGASSGQQGGQGGAAPIAGSGATAGTESLARSRGTNWALPSETSGSRAYVRPIRVACDANQIHILSQNQIVATIPVVGRTEASVDALVSEIWKTIEGWGIAGKDAFWKPELRFSILPGGQQRFADLQVLLDQSGLIIEATK